MILVIFEAGLEAAADSIVKKFGDEYKSECAVEKIAPGAVWQRPVEWDDLLIVLYQSADLPQPVDAYVRAFRDAHPTFNRDTRQDEPGGFVIPVCASSDPGRRRPPPPLSSIRSALYDGTERSVAEIVRSAGVFLGLALRPREQQIFVSYRASDGANIASALYQRLRDAGFNAWLDRAVEHGDENLAVGQAVQQVIREHIRGAALLLLVDTPDAPTSDWVTQEIEMANALLIPVIPVVVGGSRVSRFLPLKSLQRVAVVKTNVGAQPPLTDADWLVVKEEVEDLLTQAYRRRLRILNVAKELFTTYGYTWSAVDEPMRIYAARRQPARMPVTLVMSHCSVHDIDYTPTLRAYRDYLQKYPEISKVNHKLLIYDRDRMLSDPELRTINAEVQDLNFIMAHHNEIRILLKHGFQEIAE